MIRVVTAVLQRVLVSILAAAAITMVAVAEPAIDAGPAELTAAQMDSVAAGKAPVAEHISLIFLPAVQAARTAACKAGPCSAELGSSIHGHVEGLLLPAVQQ